MGNTCLSFLIHFPCKKENIIKFPKHLLVFINTQKHKISKQDGQNGHQTLHHLGHNISNNISNLANSLQRYECQGRQ